MIQFKRKQLAAIGERNLHEKMRRFLANHFPQAAAMPRAAFDAEMDALLLECRNHGLRSQRAVAAYVLANFVLGREFVAGDAALRGILSARERPNQDRALLIELWLTQAWGSLQPRTAR